MAGQSSDKVAISPDLGTLSLLPREVRDRIYEYTLYIDPETVLDGRDGPDGPIGTALLRTSHTVYDEAFVSYSRVNSWTIHIREDWRAENISIMRRPGFVLSVTHSCIKRPPPHCPNSCPGCMQVPTSVLRYAQKIEVVCGVWQGISENDVVPSTYQSLSGPERPAFRPVVEIAKEASALLKQCTKIHHLTVIIFSCEERPRSIHDVLEPFTHLRGIKTVTCFCGKWDESGTEFELKEGYNTYLKKTMALPEGTDASKYVHVPEKDADEGLDPEGIFYITELDEDYYYHDDYGSDDFTNGVNIPYDEDYEHGYDLAIDRSYGNFMQHPWDVPYYPGERAGFEPGGYENEDEFAEEDWEDEAFDEAARKQAPTTPSAAPGYSSWGPVNEAPGSWAAHLARNANPTAARPSRPSGTAKFASQSATTQAAGSSRPSESASQGTAAQAAGSSRPSGTTQSASQSTATQGTPSARPAWPPETDPNYVPEPPTFVRPPAFMEPYMAPFTGPLRPPRTSTGPSPPPAKFGPPRPPPPFSFEDPPPPPDFFGDEESFFVSGAGRPMFDGMPPLHPSAIRDFIQIMRPR